MGKVKYSDGTGRLKYVVFSDTLRKHSIPQYLDNTLNYGAGLNYAQGSSAEAAKINILNNKEFFLNANIFGNKRCVVADMDWLSTYFVDEHSDIIQLLHDTHNFHIINSEHLNFNNVDIIRDLNTYDAILYHTYKKIAFDRILSYKALKVDDLHHANDSIKFFIQHADMIISPYAYTFDKSHDHNNVIMWVPYSSALAGCSDYQEIGFNADPICKILVSGSIAWDRPFRQYVANLGSDSIAVLGHPGYGRGNLDDHQRVVGINYFRELNKYLCCFTDGHANRYIHLKNFEIASVGSLLLTDKLIEPEMNELGFIDYERPADIFGQTVVDSGSQQSENGRSDTACWNGLGEGSPYDKASGVRNIEFAFW